MPKKGHTIPVLADLLNQPTGRFAAPCLAADVNASLGRAIEVLSESEFSILPVSDQGVYVGVLTQATILKALVEEASLEDPVGQWITSHPAIAGTEPLSAAVRFLDTHGEVVVLDAAQHVRGVLSPSNLHLQKLDTQRPVMVGGMATPFGVFLTSGSAVGGKGGFNLVATGAFLMSLFFIGDRIGIQIQPYLPNTQLTAAFLSALPPIFLMAIFRFLPIAGYHAAEHQVVHAIEKGELLTPEVVARMPRVHPRCGTNLAVGVTMFGGISQSNWIADTDIRLIVALFATLFFWRAIGSLVQLYITTRKPNLKQIQSGIDAGNELLKNYAIHGTENVTPFQRIWNSGLLHVMAGSISTYLMLSLLGLV
ncbi:MAG TPA: DUF1385 domain-containing protein [Fimbriimonas sp.]|nr:DUF1385 domain-containing protein [Fimbriimonas sp.]